MTAAERSRRAGISGAVGGERQRAQRRGPTPPRAREAATDHALAAVLPALRDHDARVREVFDTTVPITRGPAVSVTGRAGWAAGSAAADLARLDVHGQLPPEAEPSAG